MCHIILSLPILALSLFYFLPFIVAMPLYLAIAVASGLVYFLLISAMKRKVQTGREGMIGKEAVVVEDINPTGRVLVGSETWAAAAHGKKFHTGEKVKICGIERMELVVEEPDAERNG
jgi:membrane-bound ClpP family serine protease